MKRRAKKLQKLPSKPNLNFEKALRDEGFTKICGVDEVGRGAWAGPVVAAAVILPAACRLNGVNDSKLLSAKERKALFGQVTAKSECYAIGMASASEVDELGLTQANALAMGRAVEALSIQPDHIIVDGYGTKFPGIPSMAIIKGDRISLSVAAASILAKVTRDELMEAMEHDYPGFGFAVHKGYGTKTHVEALQAKGPVAIHRKSYRSIAKLLENGLGL